VRTQTFERLAIAIGVFLCALPGPGVVCAQGPVADSPAIEQRVDALLSRLTLEQKIDLIGGVDSLYIRAVPEIGFPRLKMSDGPLGVRSWGPDTAYAGGIALAATWDTALAGRMGVAMGHDARARGVHFLLGPGVNLYRAPMCGRNFEYLGEDPFLSARMVVPYIEGVQSQGVIATVKHYALNNQEWDRHNASSDVEERTLREIYLPAFEAAIRQAHAGSVMNSYNLVNGVHATQNGHLNLDILKKEWGFDGILMSDWGATYDGVAAANNGLDLEMPDPNFMNRKVLLPAIQAGKVSVATVDDKVRRIFRTAIRFGFLDRDQTDLSIPPNYLPHREVALDQARESIVLLKNDKNLLPLDLKTTHTIAVLGPDAWPAVTGGGGSSTVTPFELIGIMTGMGKFAGTRAKVLYARGLPTADDVFGNTKFVGMKTADGKVDDSKAVKVETFDNPDFKGTATVSYLSNLTLWPNGDGSGTPAKAQSVRYTANYLPEKSGNYVFLAGTDSGNGYKLLVDGKPVLGEVPREGRAPQFVELPLTAGTPVAIQLDYYEANASTPRVSLGIRALDDLISPEALKIAAKADAVVMAVGFDPSLESEGYDRSYRLPFGQDALLEAVSKVNKNVIVALTGGGDVDTHRWLANVPAFLQNWYPGQEGGTALAEILFGERSPEGKLPISFARSWEENPVHDNYYAPAVPAGETPHVKYAEGVWIGYRYYTSTGKEPLYPFGYGLSYTTFDFRNLQVAPKDASVSGKVTVAFDVVNSGKVAGGEVAELYVGDPSAKVKRPSKELKGFEKVHLAPGASQHVTLTLDARAFSYWDTDANRWRVDPGKFVVYVGDSSEHTPLTADITLKP